VISCFLCLLRSFRHAKAKIMHYIVHILDSTSLCFLLLFPLLLLCRRGSFVTEQEARRTLVRTRLPGLVRRPREQHLSSALSVPVLSSSAIGPNTYRPSPKAADHDVRECERGRQQAELGIVRQKCAECTGSSERYDQRVPFGAAIVLLERRGERYLTQMLVFCHYTHTSESLLTFRTAVAAIA
jgi:hypothetical protein